MCVGDAFFVPFILSCFEYNRPFPSPPPPPRPLFQNEGRCSAFDMEIIFHCHANKTPLHKKGCAPSLILKVSVFGTRTVAYCCYIKLILGRVAKNGFEVSIHFSCFLGGREILLELFKIINSRLFTRDIQNNKKRRFLTKKLISGESENV